MHRGLPLLLLLSGCSQLAPVNALTPPIGYTRTRNLAYGPVPRQKLDVYRPKEPAGDPAPTVVFFHGGSWQHGSHPEYRFAGQALASRGFVTIVPSYRLYPEAKFPTFVEDAAAAVAWTREHAEAYGGDPNRIFLMGHSAGAHIGAMLCVDPRYLRDAGQDPSGGWIAGFIGLAGPYDFLPITDPVKKEIFGPPDRYALSQPVELIHDAPPPMLLFHGTDDKTVRLKNTQSLAAAARAAGGDVETHIYEGWGHVRVLLALAWPLRALGPVLDETESFIRRRSAPDPRE